MTRFLVLFLGFRQFQANLANATATLRSRASIKSEDDLPPPYEAQISPEAQQSPPPYHIAIAMNDDEEGDPDDIASFPVADYDDDETDSKVNFAAKKVVVRLSKVNK